MIPTPDVVSVTRENGIDYFELASGIARAQASAVQAGSAVATRSSLIERRQEAIETGNALLVLSQQVDALARAQFDRAQRIAEQLGAVKP